MLNAWNIKDNSILMVGLHYNIGRLYFIGSTSPLSLIVYSYKNSRARVKIAL